MHRKNMFRLLYRVLSLAFHIVVQERDLNGNTPTEYDRLDEYECRYAAKSNMLLRLYACISIVPNDVKVPLFYF